MKSFREMMPELLKNIEWNRLRNDIIRNPETSHQTTFNAVRRYPKRFNRSEELPSILLKYLGEPKYFEQAFESLCYLVQNSDYLCIWEPHFIKALHQLAHSKNALHKEKSVDLAVEIINVYGPLIAQENTLASISEFARSPFAKVLLDVIPNDRWGDIYISVLNITKDKEIFQKALKDEWTHEFFSIQKNVHGHEYRSMKQLLDPRSCIDEDEGVFKALQYRDEFLQDLNLQVSSIGIGLD